LFKQKLFGFVLLGRHMFEELEHKVADKVCVILVSVKRKVSDCYLKTMSVWDTGHVH
jgi:hypothetical protein